MSDEDSGTPVTTDDCGRLRGPFFHGTRAQLQPGDQLVPGRVSNFQPDRVMNNIYFSALVDTAAYGAELAVALDTALTGQGGRRRGRGHVYEVEPTGPFEDDPNVTDKKFPGNITRSYRSRHPLRVVREVHDWAGHDRERIDGMLRSLRLLREQGRDVIED